MAIIDVEQLIKDVTEAVNLSIDKDITTLQGFSKRQLKALAEQAGVIAEGVLNGDINEELQVFFLDTLERMALNFVKTLHGLAIVTVEKAWNAMVKVIWNSISNTIGQVLPLPTFSN